MEHKKMPIWRKEIDGKGQVRDVVGGWRRMIKKDVLNYFSGVLPAPRYVEKIGNHYCRRCGIFIKHKAIFYRDEYDKNKKNKTKLVKREYPITTKQWHELKVCKQCYIGLESGKEATPDLQDLKRYNIFLVNFLKYMIKTNNYFFCQSVLCRRKGQKLNTHKNGIHMFAGYKYCKECFDQRTKKSYARKK